MDPLQGLIGIKIMRLLSGVARGIVRALKFLRLENT